MAYIEKNWKKLLTLLIVTLLVIGGAVWFFRWQERQQEILHEAQQVPVRLVYSDALRDAAQAEVAALGQTLEQFEAALAQELASSKARDQAD